MWRDEALTAASYRGQAARICQESDRRTHELQPPRNVTQLQDFLEKGLRITERSVKDFKALEPPQDLKTKHDGAVEALDREVADLSALEQAISGDDANAEQAFTTAQPELERDQAAVERAMKALGLEECTPQS